MTEKAAAFVAQSTLHPGCELCEKPGGIVVASTEHCRVIRVEDASFPAFYRVVWKEHVSEFTDLTPVQRSTCMMTVAKVETVLRQHVQPHKINLASLGNQVPHLHWHVIARFEWDSHFPQAIWGVAQRAVNHETQARLSALLAALPVIDAAIASAFNTSFTSNAEVGI